MHRPDAPTLKPTGALPRTGIGTGHARMASSYRLAMVVAGIVVGASVVSFAAGLDDVGGTMWTISLMGIAVGLLAFVAAYSLGTQSQFASETHRQQDSISQIQETFESLAGKDWMTGLETFSEISKQVARELSRSARYDRVFSVMFVTPRFEGNTAVLNPGHISDIEIYSADILRKVLRLSDGIARRTDVFGFAALLPETDGAGGQIAGTRVSEALENPYRVGPWDDRTELISLDTEVLSYPEDESAIIALFGIEKPDADAPVGTTLPPNV